MSDVEAGFGNRLENAFLAILRVVILVVLAVSLVAAVGLGIYGAKDLGASEGSYQPEKVDNKALIDELRKSLETNPAASQPAPATSRPGASKGENKTLEEELDKQLKVVTEFLGKFSKSLNNPDGFKDGLRRKVTTLALDPQSEASVLDYAKGQTELLSLVLTDQQMIATLKTRDDEEFFRSFFTAAVDLYPSFFEKQRDKRREFQAEERTRVASAKAAALMRLYVAAGLFGAFLLISLILVLVKIERNLRARPI